MFSTRRNPTIRAKQPASPAPLARDGDEPGVSAGLHFEEKDHYMEKAQFADSEHKAKMVASRGASTASTEN